MKKLVLSVIIIFLTNGLLGQNENLMDKTIYQFKVQDIDGKVFDILTASFKAVFLFISTLTFKELNDLSQNANITIVLIIAKTEARNKFLLDII